MVYCSFPAKEAIKVSSSPATQVLQVAWQPGQGDLLACATSRGGKILNMEQPETEAVQLGTDMTRMTGVAWSPAGDLLATVGEQSVVWNSNGARVATLLAQPGGSHPQFNASGRLVAITSVHFAHFSMLKRLDIFDTITGVLQHSVVFIIISHVKSIVWKDELEYFCPTRYDSGSINLWRVGQEEPLQTMNGQIDTTTMAFNPEKGILASGRRDGTVRLWSSGMTTLIGHTDKVIEVIWKSHHSGILASYSLDGQVRIWDALSKTNLHMYEGFFFTESHFYFCYDMSQISFSPDGRFFAVAGRFQNVRVVRVSTGQTVAECQENGMAVSWSRGSNKIAVKTTQGRNIVDGFLNPVEENASVYNLENIMGINLKAMSMIRVASLLEMKGKDAAKEFHTNEEIPEALISDVCLYLN